MTATSKTKEAKRHAKNFISERTKTRKYNTGFSIFGIVNILNKVTIMTHDIDLELSINVFFIVEIYIIKQTKNETF